MLTFHLLQRLATGLVLIAASLGASCSSQPANTNNGAIAGQAGRSGGAAYVAGGNAGEADAMGGAAAGTPAAGASEGGSEVTAAGGDALSGAGTSGAGTSAGGSLAGSAGAAPGGVAGGVATGGKGGTGGGSATARVSKDNEALLSGSGLTLVSYGGYLNGESFQQEGIVSYQGFQYAALWNTARHVVLARRSLPSGAWASIEFTDYTNSESDAHNTISIGICPGDGTIHLAFDHHVSDLHYRKSVLGLASNSALAWSPASFSAVTKALVTGANVASLTYPKFVTEPDGKKLLFEARLGSSGSGDQYLWEYDSGSHAWKSLGMYIYGTTDSINAYPHGVSYGRGGTRLHVSWCWRDTPDASTDHDLLYAYSDDNGRTWKNNQGATVASTGASYITRGSAGIKVWTINQNRGLINQEHMLVDAAGRVHVLLSHMPDTQADDANFDSARQKSQYFHYLRSAQGTWTRTALGFPTQAAFRGKLALASSGNLYAVLPNLRIAGASAASNFSDWSILNSADSTRFFSDPLIDSARLESEDKLSVVCPQKSSPNVFVLDYTLR